MIEPPKHGDLVNSKAWQQCQAGHGPIHATRRVRTRIGPMEVYEWDLYKGFEGYCTGQDDVSRTLINQGHWEPVETKIARDILRIGDRAYGVIDVGAHIGWYSIMAAKVGFHVMAFEADAENCKTLNRNARLNKVGEKISIYNWWIDSSHPPINPEDKHFMKLDIEGNEPDAIAMFAPLLQRGGVNYVLAEISPVFNDRYPAMVERMREWGYRVFRLPEQPVTLKQLLRSPFYGELEFGQANFLFVGEHA